LWRGSLEESHREGVESEEIDRGSREGLKGGNLEGIRNKRPYCKIWEGGIASKGGRDLGGLEEEKKKVKHRQKDRRQVSVILE